MAQTVLVVEDDENVAPLEVALANMDGLCVLVLQNGREAADLLRRNSLDLVAVITDLQLPYVDGFELIKIIRSQARYSALPIVVLSGDSHPDTPERLRLLGANAFFPKPYSPSDVRHTLEDLLNAS
ncbi:MAG TPA: response regulator [Bryobacteraceae bacterium]|nr:response regulator [Bryobacteraceae bacterium]